MRAAWSLVLLTTLCAELTFTAVAVPSTWLLLPLLLVVYGAGVLLIREAVVRVGAGWTGLVLLGAAFQIAEDGVGLQALTSPRMYGSAEWGLRALGVNWSYWAAQLGVHVAFSVLIPIALLGLLFPALRDRPLLGTPGFVGVGALTIVGVVGLRSIVAAYEDPGYQQPWAWTAAFTVLVAALALLALRVVPRLSLTGPTKVGRAPRPGVAGFIGLYLTMAFLTTMLPLGLGPVLLFGDGMSHPVRLIATAMTAGAFGWVVVRWRAAVNWDDRRRIWLIGGILVSHTAFMMLGSLIGALIGAVTIAVEVALLVALAKRVERRADAVDAMSAASAR